jgi:ubiquinol-cytochrome c reductase cytochrome c1 subunit
LRSATLADHFPPPYPNENAARANNGGALPPDPVDDRQGARRRRPVCLFDPDRLPRKTPAGFKVTANKYFNPYFEGWNISMPPPLAANGVTYSDGTKATIEQQAHDVVTFLAWASEPKMEERKRFGFGTMAFLIVLAGLLFAAYRKLWKDQH